METQKLLEDCTYTYIGRDGTTEPRAEEVLAEYSVDVCINGMPAGKVTCIPEHLDLLVLGRMLTEGIISSMADIAELRLSGDSARIEVFLTDRSAVIPGQPMLKGNHTGNDAYIVDKKMASVAPIFWRPEWVFHMADCFAAGTPLHEKTWATHSCILARQADILFTCEDISRHNALDKVIGFALKNGIPLSACMVYSSGRIPTDMAAKGIRAGIPILVSKASPTAAAVSLARSCDLTLICAARKDRMKLFSGSLPG